jgi:hypothetical protein
VKTAKRVDLRPIRAAFRELMKYGILCEGGRWTCCQSCGQRDMQLRWDKAAEDEKPLGYVFWHVQDDDLLRETGELWLSFNAFDQGDSRFVGNLVVGVLKKHGVRARWKGDVRTRIECILGWREVGVRFVTKKGGAK